MKSGAIESEELMTTRRSLLASFAITLLAGLALSAGGCGTVKKVTSIPPGADKVRTGRGDVIEYKSDRSGTLYVFDEDTDDVIYKQEIGRNEEIRVDPKGGQLTVNGKDIPAGTKLVRNHRYNLYLK
jgi:hypothetical protein